MMHRGLVAALFILTGCVVATGQRGPSAPVGGGGGTMTAGGGEAPPPSGGSGKRVVPNVIGKTLDEARAAARAAGFSSEPEAGPVSCGDGAPKVKNHISCQDPEAGTEASSYAMIHVDVYSGTHMEGIIVRDQLKPLIRMTIPEAEAFLRKQYGFTGKIIVENTLQFVDKCGFDRICSITEEAGVGVHDDLHVQTNKKAAISMPPPD